VPYTVALFVLPLPYALPGPRRFLARYRWPVLAVQAVLTWVPFAIFGNSWQIGIGGLLAGLVLLTVPGRVSWLLAGGLLAAEVAVRAGLTGLPPGPAWAGYVNVVTYYVNDALVFFGMVRLAQIVGEIEEARRQSAELAVAGERFKATRSLEAAIGRRLAGIAEKAAAARLALSRDAARARAQIAAAGATARDAVAQARAITGGGRTPPLGEPAAPRPARAAIGARLAWMVLVTVLLMFVIVAIGSVFWAHLGVRLGALAVGDTVLVAALQLYHSRPAPDGRRPAAWPVTLALQAVLVYAFSSAFIGFSGGVLAPFLAGSVLLLVPGRWRWAGYAAVVASSSVLYAALPLRLLAPPVSPRPLYALNFATVCAAIGLMVYGLSRLARLARELEGLHGELARMAVVQERLRVARDVHDLLGLGLSAVALKADLAGALIGRDDTRAAAEMEEMGRICAAARADIQRVTGEGARLCLADELAAAERILVSAGIQVRADVAGGPLPAVADEVLAPVLREAVTNIVRHSTATACVIEVTSGGGVVRLAVRNDGIARRPAAARPTGDDGGRGLANLDARVRAVGGQLATRQADGRFDLVAELHSPGTGLRPAGQLPQADRFWPARGGARAANLDEASKPEIEEGGTSGGGARDREMMAPHARSVPLRQRPIR
jgi:two-component system, NarL family, sensor histidine kinase DesK